ncbi:MAG: TIM barrel protein [Nanoarchaeota archaeon]|nr:TIM barrel protein [Nanoarchaeota archaeon]
MGFNTQLNSNIEDDVNFAIKNKFNTLCIELSWKPNMDYNKREIEKFKEFSSLGNKIVIHMPFFMATNTSIKEVAEGIYKYFIKTISFAKDIGASVLTFHSGYVEQIGQYKTQKSLIENLKKIVVEGKKQGISISIENDDKGSDYPLWQLKDVKEILENVEGLDFTYDLAHANTAKEDVYNFFEEIKNYTNIIHLHNNFGKDLHNSLDDGDIDYKKIIELFKKEKKEFIYILEMRPYEKILRNRDLLN